ncbi:MAG TPA: gamma-glutamyl-gamma-aminobutyrate hydrolase family protein, partial [Bryobacteraceae bacterium]
MLKQVLLPFRHFKKAKAYETALRAGGMEPLPISVDDPMPFNRAAGLLLMGGTDVNPKRYNSEAEPETDPPDDARDQVEFDLIHDALERDLPILAICRGLQILNIYPGGTLIQH